MLQIKNHYSEKMSRNLLAIFIYSYFKKYKVAKLCSVSSTAYLILQISILPSSNFPDADCDIFSIFAQFSDGRPRHHSFPAVQHPKEDEKQNRVLTFIKELSKPKKTSISGSIEYYSKLCLSFTHL